MTIKLSLGDEVTFINKETGEKFGEATITSLYVKTLGTLEDKDWEGHNRYESEEAIYVDFRKYYSDSVGPDTEVKIIGFEFRSL